MAANRMSRLLSTTLFYLIGLIVYVFIVFGFFLPGEGLLDVGTWLWGLLFSPVLPSYGNKIIANNIASVERMQAVITEWPLNIIGISCICFPLLLDYIYSVRRKYMTAKLTRAKVRTTITWCAGIALFQLITSSALSYFRGEYMPLAMQSNIFTASIIFLLGLFIARFRISFKDTKQIQRETIRGQQQGQVKKVVAVLNKEAHKSGDSYIINTRVNLRIASKRLRPCLAIWGSSGAGKGRILTPFIREIVQSAQATDMCAYIVDKKGEYVSKLYGLADTYILAPRDARSIKFQPTIRDASDAMVFARCCIQQRPDEKDPFWTNAARNVMVGILLALQGLPDEKLTWRTLAEAMVSFDRIEYLLKHTMEGRSALMEIEQRDKMAVSLMATFKSQCFFFISLTQAWGDEQDFDIEDFVVKQHGVIVLRLDVQEDPDLAAKLSTLFLESTIRLSLSKYDEIYSNSPHAKKKQAWWILDEFENLLFMPSLAELIKTGRSKGLGTVIATQTVSGVKEKYGQSGLDSIAENSTWIVLQSSGESAQFLSKGMGDQEELLTKRSQQTDSLGLRQAEEGLTQEIRTAAVVLAGELAELQVPTTAGGQLEGFLRARNLPVTKFTWTAVTDALADREPAQVPAHWVGKIHLLSGDLGDEGHAPASVAGKAKTDDAREDPEAEETDQAKPRPKEAMGKAPGDAFDF